MKKFTIKPKQNPIVSAFLMVVVTLVFLFGFVTPVNALDVSGIEIVEGTGLVGPGGGVVTLGMTRDQIKEVATNGNCDSADVCSFRLTPETAVVTVTFDASDKVEYITVNQHGLWQEDKWPTSSTNTVIDNMSVEQVADLYADNGAAIVSQYPYEYVVVEELGYTYQYRISCSYAGCTEYTVHHIYASSQTSSSQEFEGAIVIENPRKKDKTYDIDLEIVVPTGEVINASFKARIPAKGSISLDPGEFVDVNGTLGQYDYTARLLNKRGRLVDTSIGSFWIVE